MRFYNLSYEAIVALAKIVAEDLGMQPINEGRLLQELRAYPPMPVIIDNGDVQLWVDRYDVAYSLETEKFVHYVYIAPEHAKEELPDLPELIVKCKNKERVEMMRDIMHQLKKAVDKKPYLTPKYKRMMEQASAVEN